MAPLRNAEAGSAAAGTEIGANPEPTTGPDASVAPDASAEGAGPARHDVTARPSERPLAEDMKADHPVRPFFFLRPRPCTPPTCIRYRPGRRTALGCHPSLGP